MLQYAMSERGEAGKRPQATPLDRLGRVPLAVRGGVLSLLLRHLRCLI